MNEFKVGDKVISRDHDHIGYFGETGTIEAISESGDLYGVLFSDGRFLSHWAYEMERVGPATPTPLQAAAKALYDFLDGNGATEIITGWDERNNEPFSLDLSHPLYGLVAFPDRISELQQALEDALRAEGAIPEKCHDSLQCNDRTRTDDECDLLEVL